MLTCKICHLKNLPENHYWQYHRISIQKYLEEYEPRIDLFDKSPIVYKSPRQYLLSYFNGRRNLSNYLKSASKEEISLYLQNSLKEQARLLEWIYIPTEVEITSYINPKISTINKYINFYEYCEKELGLIPRFNDPFLDIFDELKENKDIEIICDTREQSLIKLDNSIIQKLDFGDYSVNTSGKIYAVERKSLEDFIGSMTKDYDRIEREIVRAKESDGYLFFLIESPFSKCMTFDYDKSLIKRTRGQMKTTPDYVFSNLRKLQRQYNNIQFLFTDGREEFKKYLKLILFNAERLSQCDLQANYNMKNIIV